MTRRGESQLEKLREEATCPQCEYSLRGLEGDVVTCPECDTRIDIALLLRSGIKGFWGNVPGYAVIVTPAWIVPIGFFVAYYSYMAVGLGGTLDDVIPVWVGTCVIWLSNFVIVRLITKWNMAVLLSFMACGLMAAYFAGPILAVYAFVIIYDAQIWMDTCIGLFLLAVGVIVPLLARRGERYIASLCLKRFLRLASMS